MARLSLAVLLALLALLQGCASTRAMSSWQLPLSAPKPQFKHLFVIALTPLDPVAVQLEAELASRLADEGIAATPARQHFAEAELRDAQARERIAGKVRALGADGVLVIAYLHSAEKKYYVPGTTTWVPAPPPPPRHGGYPAYIGYHYDLVYQPGYTAVSTEYYMKSSLYQVGEEQPVWTAQSATADPTSISDGISSFSRALVRELRTAGVLPK
jgi:hypothetical protein